MSLKGIILAGGHGTRLYPLTLGTSKQLLPVYDKPMIYYPLSVLLFSGIRDILIISTEEDIPKFQRLLGNGSSFGINLSYEVQSKPNGIAESFIIAEKFINKSNVCLILGDNIFYGLETSSKLFEAKSALMNGNSTIFAVKVKNPTHFGVISLNELNKYQIIEKPKKTKSNLIVSGLYFYTNDVINIAKKLTPSIRGELEITDVNNFMLSKDNLSIIELDSSIKWIDTGTYNSLLNASEFFKNIEKKTGKKYACVEEIAYELGYINKNKLEQISNSMNKSEYGQYLGNII